MVSFHDPFGARIATAGLLASLVVMVQGCATTAVPVSEVGPGNIGKVDPVLPNGKVGVWMDTVYQLPGDEVTAWIVVDRDAADEKRGRYFIARTITSCASSTIAVQRWKTGDVQDRHAGGLTSYTPPGPITLSSDNPRIASLMRTICERADAQARERAEARAKSEAVAVHPSGWNPAERPAGGGEMEGAQAAAVADGPKRELPWTARGALAGLAVCWVPAAVLGAGGSGIDPFVLVGLVIGVVCTPFGVSAGAAIGAVRDVTTLVTKD
jgi:hypothetical protein